MLVAIFGKTLRLILELTKKKQNLLKHLKLNFEHSIQKHILCTFENVNFSITVLILIARLYVIDNKLGKIENHS